MRPWVIAHNAGLEAGAAGSIESFTDALESGCEAVEFDIRRRPDGALVVQHDPVTEQDDPPLLEAVLDLLGTRLLCNLELKEDGYVADILAMAQPRLPADKKIVSSAIDAAVRAASAHVATGLVIGRKRDPTPTYEETARRVEACGAEYLCAHFSVIEHGLFDWAERLGTPALIWTVNDDEMLRALLRDDRVGGVFTDYPRRAVSLRGR